MRQSGIPHAGPTGHGQDDKLSKNMKITKRSHRFTVNIGNFDFGFDRKVLPDEVRAGLATNPTRLLPRTGYGEANPIRVNPTKSNQIKPKILNRPLLGKAASRTRDHPIKCISRRDIGAFSACRFRGSGIKSDF
jgi:hypothetical protein